MLLKTFSFNQRCRSGAAWLQEENPGLFALDCLRDRLVFVAPDNQVHPFGDGLLLNAVTLASATYIALVLVLVEYQNIEPGVVRAVIFLEWPVEVDFIQFKRKVQTQVFNMAKPKKRNFSLIFGEQHGLHFYIVDVSTLPKIIDVGIYC